MPKNDTTKLCYYQCLRNNTFSKFTDRILMIVVKDAKCDLLPSADDIDI